MNSDMTKYCYQHFECAYNIGWNTDPYGPDESQKLLDPIFLQRIIEYCEHPLNKELNGIHRYVEVDGKKYAKGFGEIRIIDTKKKIRYAAPNVIADDIMNKKYTPPKEFVEAVLEGPAFDSEEYQKFYLEYSEENFWGETKENCERIGRAIFLLENDFENFKCYILENQLLDIVSLRGSLLNYALETGKDREAYWLIENGIDINAFDGLELLTAIRNENTEIAKLLIDKGIVADGREIKDNPLISAIQHSNSFLVEELMKKYRHLIKTYSNEYVRDYTILDFASKLSNDKIIEIVKQYLN